MDISKVVEYAQEMYECDRKIDIVELCGQFGIKVYGDNDTDINAKISFNKKDGFEIIFNSNHPLNRIRFSIAHELAHFFLHKEEIVKKKSLYRSEDLSEQEKEADFLAEKILMPEKSIKEFMDKFDQSGILDEKVIRLVAKEFDVSIIVAAIRLRNLNYKVPYISNSNV